MSIIQQYTSKFNDETNSSQTISAPQLTPEHTDTLAQSGIDAQAAERLGMYSANEHEVAVLLGRSTAVGCGLVIPYPNPQTGDTLTYNRNGTEHEFLRVRLDQPGLAPDAKGNASKYLSPSGSGQQPYIIPNVAEYIVKGGNEIILVEGEKKAISAFCYGLYAIGLSGNWGWKAKDRFELLPLLDEYIRSGMTIIVIWDSDAALNTGFAVSTRMLHGCLRKKGCNVKVIVLPQTGKHKSGLDDFIVSSGVEALRELINGAPSLPDRSVTVNELIASWYESLLPALCELPEDEASVLFFDNCRKGLVDGVDCNTRRAVINGIKRATKIDVDRLFDNAVRGYLHNNYPGSALESNTACRPGQRAKIGDDRTVKIAVVENGIAWVSDVKYADKTEPVPVSVLTNIEHASGPCAAELADLFVNKYYMGESGDLLLRHYRVGFARWSGAGYIEVADADMEAQIMGFLRDEYPKDATPARQNAVVENLKAAGLCHIPAPVETPCLLIDSEWQTLPDVIPFRNGNLNIAELRGGKQDECVFTPPTPRLFTLTGRDYDFDPDAQCPRFITFLNEVLPDAELRALVQELAGYCLIPDTSYQRFFLFYGNGANGKAVFSDVLMDVVGRQNVCSVSLARFGERFSLWPLSQKLVNLVAEGPAVEQGSFRVAEDKLKAIVSGDPIEIERKNRDILTARPTARLIFSCNELPRFIDRSDGIWRRLIVVPFNVWIPPDRQDPDLARRIINNELPGVFNWALTGLLRLQSRGRFIEPEACRRLKSEHRLTCSPELEFFREYVQAGRPGDFTRTDEIYAAYRTCMQSSGNGVMSQSRVVDSLRRQFPECRPGRRTVEGQRVRGFTGIVFSPDGSANAEEEQ